jgi:two-component system, NarL family, response regulator LiaR
MGNQLIKVLVVDRLKMVRQGIDALLGEYEDIRVIGEADNGPSAIQLIERLKPDVVLTELVLPGMDGVEAIRKMAAARPGVRILVLTGYTGDDKILAAIRAGALGYLLKSAQPEELVQAIRDVSAGEPAFSPKITWKLLHGIGPENTTRPAAAALSQREIEVLRLMTLGKTDHEIAEQLVLGDVTIRTHISRILSKLGLKNRVLAALYGVRTGLVSLEETSA